MFSLMGYKQNFHTPYLVKILQLGKKHGESLVGVNEHSKI